MTGVRNSIRQQQSSWVCNATCKTCTFCINAGSVCDLTMICVSRSMTAAFSSARLHVQGKLWPGQSGTEQTEWAEAWPWTLGTTGRRSNGRKRPAGSRREITGKWGKKKNGSLWWEGMWNHGGMSFFAVLFSVIRCMFPILQVLKFIIAPPPSSLHPLCLRFPLESCRQAFILILIKASGTVFHPQPCRLLSPSGGAVKLFIIAQTIGDGRRTWLQGVECNLARTLGGRCAEFDNRW